MNFKWIKNMIEVEDGIIESVVKPRTGTAKGVYVPMPSKYLGRKVTVIVSHEYIEGFDPDKYRKEHS